MAEPMKIRAPFLILASASLGSLRLLSYTSFQL